MVDASYYSVIEGCIREIMRHYQTAYWNKYFKEYTALPINYSGNRIDFENFYIHAADDSNDPNFEYNGLRVYWGDYLGDQNFMESDKNIDLDFLANMMDDCINSIDRWCKYGDN